MQKTLGLVMIVKDEVATINITLGSMRGHIDEWTIVDTGSTDGTQARHHALEPDVTAPVGSAAMLQMMLGPWLRLRSCFPGYCRLIQF